jgi:hypothetical protein
MALAPTLIIERRRNALVAEWKQNPLIVVQVESPAVLTFLDDRGQGGGVGAVGRRSQTNTVIVSRVGGDPDRNGSVWGKASYTGYRTAFIGFLNHVYGTQATTADLAGYDVDHLLNRARSPGAGYIRIEAVNSTVNQAWGRLFEKAASNPAFFANQQRLRRTLSWAICAKLANRLRPNGPNDVGGITQLAAYFQTLGMDASEAREGLTSMLNFAYGMR